MASHRGQIVSTAPCRIFLGIDESTGEALNARRVAERVGFMSDLLREAAQRIVDEHWTAGDLAVLASGVGPDERKLPSHGHSALRMLGWMPVLPEGVYAPERARRVAAENAARMLRSAAAFSAPLVAAICATWPADGKRTSEEWDALWAAAPAGADKTSVRNRTRQIAARLSAGEAMPESITGIEAAPRVHGQLLLAAVDGAFVAFCPAEPDDEDQRRILRVKLPTVAQPAKADWVWHELRVTIPTYVPDTASLSTPTLRLIDGVVAADVPFTVAAKPAATKGHTVALGIDWGLNTLLTASVARLGGDGVVTADPEPLSFDATGISVKVAALRRQREFLLGKVDRWEVLQSGRAVRDVHLDALIARTQTESSNVSRRQSNLNADLSRKAARWAVDQAVAAGATAIYIEDLATLETRGLSRNLHRRLGGHVRGKVFEAMRHAAAKEGIAVVSVPARGTSAKCPGCLANLKHVKASNNRTAGHKWSACDKCGLSLDRDHSASRRIVSRGLAGQADTRKARSGELTIKTPVDEPVAVSRDKHVATPRRISRRRVQRFAYQTPPRRLVPAPAPAGQRPAGKRSQGGNTQTLHDMRSARSLRGAGLAPHVRATPVLSRPSPLAA